MDRPRLSIRCASLAAALLLSGPAAAEEAATVAPESRALVVELLELSGGRQMLEQIVQMMVVSVQQGTASAIESYIASRPELSEEEKVQLRAELADRDRMAARFAFEIPRLFDYDELVDKVYVPIYTKHFTREELAAIVGFYRTPVGEKSLRVAPAMMQESTEAIALVTQPALFRLVDQILEEEAARALE